MLRKTDAYKMTGDGLRDDGCRKVMMMYKMTDCTKEEN